jgi:ribosomal protein S18 acetylase RimI-like enzyme
VSDAAKFPLEGGCDCRRIRYRMESAPLIVHCCHCRWCQRESGASFALNAMIESDRVTRLTGVPDLIHTPSASGKGQMIARCPECQVAVWSNYSTAGSLIDFVRVGTLDAPDQLPPDVHIFTASKQPWVIIPAGMKSVPEYYDRETVWSVQSLQRRNLLLSSTRCSGNVDVRRGVVADAAALAEFAARSFADAFAADNNPHDLQAHLTASFGAPQQTRELEDPGVITLLAQSAGALIGYAQVRVKRPPDCITQPHAVEIHRFYVDRSAHGKGVARQLMNAAFDAARSLQGKHVWLSVWERNPRAIAFYGKCGFLDVGSTDFFVGPDRQTDRVLIASLPL